MPLERRQAIAEIVRKHDAYLLEDDAYGYLLSPPLPPVSRLIPERSFYIVSFAKCLAPGLAHRRDDRAGGVPRSLDQRVARHRLDGGACDGRSGGAADP